MDSQETALTPIARSFRELSDVDVTSMEQTSVLLKTGWSGSFGWPKLLESKRILIVSEAGTGKTHECRAIQSALWDRGEASFYFDLAQLSKTNLRDLLSDEQEVRFNAWLASQSDVATIFLDSIDELKLSLGSFELALVRLSKALAGQLGRTRIVITTRPIPFDIHLIKKLLPIPQVGKQAASGEAFADIAMNRNRKENKSKKEIDKELGWRNVALMPLSDDQIRHLAIHQGVKDANALLEDIRKRNAGDFARRPQDLIELCADWLAHQRIRTHREQVLQNIFVKLKPRSDRPEKTPLSQSRATEGASRLAIAALLTRKLTIRHSAEADKGGESTAALDPAAILLDWSADERETLLERALFGFASYGRVRFHHRSVVEFLAAQHLESLLRKGMSMKAVKRLLFADTQQGIRVVKPSMRQVAAWLASSQPSIFGEIRDCEPSVLLDHADPESLSATQRIDALRAYVECYGQGGWRGMQIPGLQVQRFATNDLSNEVLRLWESGINNSEVRELLLELVAAVPMRECADIAYSVVMNGSLDNSERVDALNALIKLNDSRLHEISLSIEMDQSIWPNQLTKNAVARLFPDNIAVERLCNILERLNESVHRADDLNWFWASTIAEAKIAPEYLNTFRIRLTNRIAEDVVWVTEWPHLATSYPHLIGPLAAVCLRELAEGRVSHEVIISSIIALRFARDDHSRDEPLSNLREQISNSSASVRELAFLADDTLNQSTHPIEDPWGRYFAASYRGAINLNTAQDNEWVLARLSDQKRPTAERAVMLEAAIREFWNGQGELHDYLSRLKLRINDCPILLSRIEQCFKPVIVDPEFAKLDAERQKTRQQTEARHAEAHESWVSFWGEVSSNPETAFSPDKAGDTSRNLWEAMRRAGEESRASGWSRRFIEHHFSKEIADQLRLAMTKIWRNDRPTLRSERPISERDTLLSRWQLGLAAIAAEAEDTSWAERLTQDEAELATRYAPIELNGFPSWLEGLALVHSVAVLNVLSTEVSNELDEIAAANSYCMLLQNIRYAAPTLAELFLPLLWGWLNSNSLVIREGEDANRTVERLRRVVDIILQHGTDVMHDQIKLIAARELADGLNVPFASVWFPVLMRLDAESGTEKLELSLAEIDPGPDGHGVEWISMLFGNRHNESLVDLALPQFTPSLLLRLVRLAYRYVRICDDAVHIGAYSPDSRDRAEQGRSALLSALLDKKGPEAWLAKLEMANDPLFSHFRDRALSVAREKAAEEADSTVLKESEIVALNSNLEAPPTTHDEMFSLLVDRLDDLDDLLLSDISPREAWAGISDEKIMRREIARELRNAANFAYTVDQEAATADEKETDIRLRASSSNQQAVIELKLGDDRSGRDLRDTILDQLVKKYMGPEECRSGCLLVTVNKDRTWEHPDSKKRLDIEGLEAMLKDEALKIAEDMGLEIRLIARVLNLRKRLPTEKDASK